MVYEKEYPMTLKTVLDKKKGIIAGQGIIEEWSFYVAGTIKSDGKVTFYAVSEEEPTYTFTGLYKDGKIKGKYSVPRLGGALQMKQTGETKGIALSFHELLLKSIQIVFLSFFLNLFLSCAANFSVHDLEATLGVTLECPVCNLDDPEANFLETVDDLLLQ